MLKCGRQSVPGPLKRKFQIRSHRKCAVINNYIQLLPAWHEDCLPFSRKNIQRINLRRHVHVIGASYCVLYVMGERRHLVKGRHFAIRIESFESSYPQIVLLRQLCKCNDTWVLEPTIFQVRNAWKSNLFSILIFKTFENGFAFSKEFKNGCTVDLRFRRKWKTDVWFQIFEPMCYSKKYIFTSQEDETVLCIMFLSCLHTQSKHVSNS